MAALFFHQVPAALLGLVYIYSRFMYFSGYGKAVEARLPGFKLGVRCLMGLLMLALFGISTITLRRYTDIDLKLMAVEKAATFYPEIRHLV